MKVSEQLKAAKALIDAPEKWIQGASAIDANENHCSAQDVEAVCFCSIGAIARITGVSSRFLPVRAYLKISMGDFISHFNDTHSHIEVMAMFDKAISLAEGDENVVKLD